MIMFIVVTFVIAVSSKLLIDKKILDAWSSHCSVIITHSRWLDLTFPIHFLKYLMCEVCAQFVVIKAGVSKAFVRNFVYLNYGSPCGQNDACHITAPGLK